jgi:hypothetical protein
MGLQDRDYMREDHKRRAKLVWNDRSGELEYDHRKPQRRRWRWPYRLRPGLPWWVTEPLRITLFMVPFALAYYAWKYLS